MLPRIKILARMAIGGLALGPWLPLAGTPPTLIDPTYALPFDVGDPARPGFVWRIHQLARPDQPNDNRRTEEQLAGRLGPNVANAAAVGGADGPGVPATSGVAANLPLTFTVSSTINFDVLGAPRGTLGGDRRIPGIPGRTGSTNNVAAEVLTWIRFVEGVYTFVVNSDDGFTFSLGGLSPSDPFASVIGRFEGGRGATESVFSFDIRKTGTYAARLTWEQGVGDASVELFQRRGSSDALVNDPSMDGLPAFRQLLPGWNPASIESVRPYPGQLDAPFDEGIAVVLVDGDEVPIDEATIRLFVDGAEVVPGRRREGDRVHITYQPPGTGWWAPQSVHIVALQFNGPGIVTRSWDFVVGDYAVLTPAMRQAADPSLPGFRWTIFQNAANQETSSQRAEDALAGRLKGLDGLPLPNQANSTRRGAAIGPGAPVGATVGASLPLRFEIPGVINLDQDPGANGGNFAGDQTMPGIPGASDGTDGIAAEILAWVDLPAGVIRLGVNSDDGFRMTGGASAKPGQAVLLGAFEGGRSATDSLLRFVVQAPGLYPIRTLWYEGAGGASLEIFSVTSDGRKILLNDLANGGFKTYRAPAPQTLAVNVPAGFSLIANPYSRGDNTLSEVLPDLPEGSILYQWSPSNARFRSSVYLLGKRWVPNFTFAPGAGAFLQSPTPATVTWVGQPLPSPQQRPITAGFNLLGSPLPKTGRLDTDLQFPATVNDRLFRWDANLAAYSSYTFRAGIGWVPAGHSLRLAEGFFVNAVTARTWVQTAAETGFLPFGSVSTGHAFSPLEAFSAGPSVSPPPTGARPAVRHAFQALLNFCNGAFNNAAGEIVRVGPPLVGGGVGVDYVVGLWTGPANAPGTLQALSHANLPTEIQERGIFGSPDEGAGSVLTWDVANSGPVYLQARAWRPGTESRTWDQAVASSSEVVYESNIFELPPSAASADGAPIPPPVPAGLTNFLIRPALTTFTQTPASPVFSSNLVITVSGAATADLPITFTSPDSGRAVSLGGNAFSIKAAGSIPILVAIAGSGDYQPVTYTKFIRADQAPQTLAFTPALTANQSVNLGTTIRASASSGLVPTLNATDPSRVRPTGPGSVLLVAQGNVRLTASSPADANYLAASASIDLQVIEPRLRAGFDRATGTVQINLDAAPGSRFIVIRATALAEPTVWTPLGGQTGTVPGTGTLTFGLVQSAGAGFYRVQFLE